MNKNNFSKSNLRILEKTENKSLKDKSLRRKGAKRQKQKVWNLIEVSQRN